MPPPPGSAPPHDAEPRDRTMRARDDDVSAARGGSDGGAPASTTGGSRARPIVGSFHLRQRTGDSGRLGRRQRWSAAAAATVITTATVALLLAVLADRLAFPAPASQAVALSPAEALRWMAMPPATGAAGAEDVTSAAEAPAYTSARIPPLLLAAPRDTGASRTIGPRRGAAAPPPARLDPRLQPAPDALPDRLPALPRGTLVLPGRLHACADGLCPEQPSASGESGVMRRTGPPLTDARRDSLLRVMEDRVARATRMANENRPSNGTPPAGDNGGFGPTQQTGGGSISIGLPGGGPTAAERRRDSTAHAAGRRQIGRLDARADSLRRDSVRRDSLRRASAGPRRAPE